MSDNLTLRERVGSYDLVAMEFSLAEGSVVESAALLLMGSVGGSTPQLEAAWDGYVVGYSVQSEAGANFGLTVEIAGSSATGGAITVGGATGYGQFQPGLAFSAGDSVGIDCGTVTTARDINVILYLAYNVG